MHRHSPASRDIIQLACGLRHGVMNDGGHGVASADICPYRVTN